VAGRTLYLSSLESTRFEPVRECRIVDQIAFDTGKVAVVAWLQPPVVGQDINRAGELHTVILAARHEEASVAPVSEFPCFVFIAIPRVGRTTLRSPVRSEDSEIIGWGELYRTHADAASHVFG
jgi:hypothetical protein